MALAKSETLTHSRTVTKTVEVESVETYKTQQVTLVLSMEEARTLSHMVGYVGGLPRNTRRMHADSIATALSEAGVPTSYELEFEAEDRNSFARESELGWYVGVFVPQDESESKPARPLTEHPAMDTRVVRITPFHVIYQDEDPATARDYGTRECRVGDLGTVMSRPHGGNRPCVTVLWDQGGSSSIAPKCLALA